MKYQRATDPHSIPNIRHGQRSLLSALAKIPVLTGRKTIETTTSGSPRYSRMKYLGSPKRLARNLRHLHHHCCATLQGHHLRRNTHGAGISQCLQDYMRVSRNRRSTASHGHLLLQHLQKNYMQLSVKSAKARLEKYTRPAIP